jgi:hypothetical protein
LLLLGVLHVHALYALIPSLESPSDLTAAVVQMKMLTPHVVLFFALAGMTSRRLAGKSLRSVLQQSILLLLVGAAAHVLGTLVEHALWLPWNGWYPLLRDIGKPLLFGTGLLSLGWFFVTLAVVRMFAYTWGRSLVVFALAAAAVTLGVAASRALGGPDNLYEWRNWPAAFVAFMIGQRVSQDLHVPHAIGVPCFVIGLVLPLLNHPGLLNGGLSLHSHISFIAYPTVGGFGFAPLYFVQEFIALFGLLWLVRQFGAHHFARLLAWFGRRSLVLLMLHSCIASALYGLYKAIDPPIDGLAFFAVVLVVNPLAHFVAYRLVGRQADGVIALCARAARWVVFATRRPMIRRS